MDWRGWMTTRNIWNKSGQDNFNWWPHQKAHKIKRRIHNNTFIFKSIKLKNVSYGNLKPPNSPLGDQWFSICIHDNNLCIFLCNIPQSTSLIESLQNPYCSWLQWMNESSFFCPGSLLIAAFSLNQLSIWSEWIGKKNPSFQFWKNIVVTMVSVEKSNNPHIYFECIHQIYVFWYELVGIFIVSEDWLNLDS